MLYNFLEGSGGTERHSDVLGTSSRGGQGEKGEEATGESWATRRRDTLLGHFSHSGQLARKKSGRPAEIQVSQWGLPFKLLNQA